jgi:hypothetical protein
MDIEKLKEDIRNVEYDLEYGEDQDQGKVAVNVECLRSVINFAKEAIARQSVKSEEVQEAIDMLQVIRPSENEIKSGEYPDVADAIDLAIAALQAYQPTTRKDRIVEEVAISKTETTSCEWCEIASECEYEVTFFEDGDRWAKHRELMPRYCPNCGRKLEG